MVEESALPGASMVPSLRYFAAYWSAVLFANAAVAQTVSVVLATERTAIAIETTTPLPATAVCKAEVTGSRLTSASLTTPLAMVTLALNESATQASFSQGFVPAMGASAPSDQLDAAYPAGTYTFDVTWTKLGGGTQEGHYERTLPVDWPATPLLASPQPLRSLPAETVEFQWGEFVGAAEGSSISFALYEGNLSAELLQQLAAGDLSGLQSLAVVDYAPELAADTSTRLSDGIDTALDHLLVLQFSTEDTLAAVPVQTVRRASKIVVYFYRDEPLTYERWLTFYFTEEERAAGTLTPPEADPDNDGVANLAEYGCEMNPRSADREGLPEATTIDGVFVMEYRRILEATDLSWSYEQLTDDASWVTLEPETYTEAVVESFVTSERVRVTPADTGTRSVLRVRVELTAAP